MTIDERVAALEGKMDVLIVLVTSTFILMVSGMVVHV